MTIWTKRHATYCVQNRLTPTAVVLWQWLLHEMPESSTEIIDLHDFNKWVEDTRGKPHDPKSVKSATKQLIKVGVLTRAQSYTSHVWKWTLKSINLLLPPTPPPTPKKSTAKPKIPDPQPQTDQSSETGNNSSSSINLEEKSKDADEILAECEAAGIPFVKAERPKVLNFPLHQVKIALAYFQYRYPDQESQLEIRSLQGTLIYFLRKQCWNQNINFLMNLNAYKIVPDWVLTLCLGDDTLDPVF
jgi:hypothetical protein